MADLNSLQHELGTPLGTKNRTTSVARHIIYDNYVARIRQIYIFIIYVMVTI